MGRRFENGVVGTTNGSIGQLSVTANTLTTTQTNTDLIIDPQGTGAIRLVGTTQLNAASPLRYYDTTTTNYVGLKSGSVSASYTLTWPGAVTGTNGYALTSDTSGNLSWSVIGITVSSITTSGTYYPLFTSATSGGVSSANITSSKLSFDPGTGTLTTTTLSAGTLTETSSIVLKENFRSIDNALDKISQLTGWIYDRKDGSSNDEVGVVAEEVNKIIPNLVKKDAEGNPESVAYTRLTAYLIEAVKQLNNELKEIKGKV